MSIAPSRQPIRWPMILILVLALLPYQAQALSLSLSPSQIEEALDYGQKARALPFAVFAREWRTEGVQRADQRLGGIAWLQSPFARVAHTGWTAAHRGLSLNAEEVKRQLKDMGPRLAFAITLLSPTEDAETYDVSLHQAGEIIDPSHVEKGQDDSGEEMSWVYLYCVFPAEGIDLQGTVILVVTGPQGDQLPFVFDLSAMR